MKLVSRVFSFRVAFCLKLGSTLCERRSICCWHLEARRDFCFDFSRDPKKNKFISFYVDYVYDTMDIEWEAVLSKEEIFQQNKNRINYMIKKWTYHEINL